MLIFIGTLHLGLTPKEELTKIIGDLNPSRLLIEIVQDDIENNRLEEYPDEMVATLKWARTKHIEVYGFDSRIQPIKEKVLKEDLESLVGEQMVIIKKHSWKDFNASCLENALKTSSWYKVIDKTKDGERELEMFNNIVSMSDDSKITVVITGSGHIPFFRNKLPDAQFPLNTLESP